MSLEENKELARRFEEEIHNQHNLEVIDEIIAPQFVNNGPNGSQTMSREELKEMFRGLFGAVPDFHDEVHEMVAEGDLIALRATRSGTFKEKTGDLEPTGKHASIAVFHLLRIENGMIAECWYLHDTVAEQKWIGTYGKE